MLKKINLLLLTLTAFSCSNSDKQSQSSEFFRSPSDSIRALKIENNLIPMYSLKGNVRRSDIPTMMKEDSIPGLSIAFVDNGEIAWTKHYGYANLKDSIPIDAQTVFTGASLSKPITAYAALNLVDKGTLSLDEDVNLKLKDWKVPENAFTEENKVTLRRLIGHSSGIKNDLWSSYLPTDNIPTINQMLSGAEPSIDPAVSMVFEPGSRTKYSNPGYAVIQKLLMDVKEDDFDSIINELVFQPTGMESSSFNQPIPKELMENRATGYSRELEPFPYRIFPYEAAGGIWTTTNDLAKFMISVLNDYHNESNIILSKDMSKTVFNKSTERFAFSLWNWGDDIVFRHTGSNQGFNCLMYGSIDKKQGLIVMTNSENAFGIFEYIQRAINKEYQWEYVIPEILVPIDKNITWVDEYLGNYRWRGYSINLTKKDDDLILFIDNEQYLLTQVGDYDFISNELSIKLTFSNNEDSYFYGMTLWGPGGGPSTLDKIN